MTNSIKIKTASGLEVTAELVTEHEIGCEEWTGKKIMQTVTPYITIDVPGHFRFNAEKKDGTIIQDTFTTTDQASGKTVKPGIRVAADDMIIIDEMFAAKDKIISSQREVEKAAAQWNTKNEKLAQHICNS